MKPIRPALSTVIASTVIALILLLGCPLFSWAQEKDPALERYYSANALYNRKLYILAAEEYASFLDAFSRHEKAPNARLGLALCHYALKSPKKAEPLFAQLTRESSLENQEEIHNLWGQCLLSLDRIEEAEKAFAFTADRSRDPALREQACSGQVEALYRQSNWQAVIQMSDRFMSDITDAERLRRSCFQGAVARFELNRFEEAGKILADLSRTSNPSPLQQHIVFLLAECQRQTGDNQQAIASYDRAARQLKGAFTAEALYRLGFLRFKENSYTQAAADFMEVLEEHGTSTSAAPAKLYLGRCLFELGRFKEAEKLLLTFSPSQEEYPQARLWLSRAVVQDGNPARAEKTLDEAIRKIGDNTASLDLFFEKAALQMDRGDHQNAARSFQEIHQQDSAGVQAPEALWLETFCLHKAGLYEESLDRCNTFLVKNRKSSHAVEALFLKGENLFLLQQPAEANPIYRDFISRHGDNPYADSARFRLAQILYQKEEWQEAFTALEPFNRKKPDQAFFNTLDYIRGDCCYHLGQWNPAIESFSRFVTEYPHESNADLAVFKTALAMARLGDRDRALATLKAFSSHFPESPYIARAHVEVGRMEYEAGRFESARTCLEKTPDRDQDPYCLYYLGYVMTALGDLEEGGQWFARLGKRFPEHELEPDANLQRGVLEVRQNRFQKGQSLLADFLDEHGDNAKADQAWFYLGLALSRQESWVEGARSFQRVHEEYPTSALRDRALYEWAWCEKGRDQKDLAAQRYDTLLESCPESALAGDVAFERAELDYENQDYAAAIHRLTALLESANPDDLRERILYRLGWNCFLKDDMPAAATWFERLLDEFPEAENRAIARYQAGEARLKRKEHEPAYQHFKALAALDHHNEYQEQTLLRLGECAALTQRWEESGEVYRAFTHQYPESPFLNQALFGQGWAQENQEEYTEAVTAYEKVLARNQYDETSARSQFQIGECLFALKEYKEAIKALIKVETLYAYPRWSARALLESGRALELPGNIQEARAQYQEVIDKYPDSDAAAIARKKLETL